MKFTVILIILFAKDVINHNVDEKKSIAEIDALLNAVTQETWREDERPCFRAMLAMLNGVQNSTLWATWMWDSNHRPMGTLYGLKNHLGNFDQCLNPPWLDEYPELRPQYCLVDFQLSEGNLHDGRSYFKPYESATTYINTKSQRGRHMNAVSWGLCLPIQCSINSVATLGKLMARISHLTVMSEDPTITVNYCHLAGETASYGFGARVFFMVMVSLLLTTIVLTYYGQKHTFIKTSNSFGAKVVQSFCLKSNYAALFNVQGSEISAMNGMRCITSFFVVGAHVYLFAAGCGMINALRMDKDAASYLSIIFLHMDLLVDTFFCFSGLLHTISLLSAKPDRPHNIFKLICKRYVRLIGAFAVAVLYMTFVFGDTDQGPLWRKMAVAEQNFCVKNWWRCLLMLTTSAKEMCYIVSWYVPCDFQLTITSTLIFYIYRKNKKNGLLVYGIVSLLAILIPGFLTYRYRLQPVITFTMQDIVILRSIASLDYVYVETYSRAGSYMVGMAMGYLMTTFKPEKYRKVIPKIWSFLGTVSAVAAMVSTMSLGTIFQDRAYSNLEISVSVAMDRVVWAFAVCCIVGICVYGDLPIINDFLSWSLFRPLGRLSYGIYLFHPLFLQQALFSLRTPIKYDHLAFLILAFGITCVTCVASLFVWLVVEAPLSKFFNDLLSNKISQKKIETVTINGIQNGQKKVL